MSEDTPNTENQVVDTTPTTPKAIVVTANAALRVYAEDEAPKGPGSLMLPSETLETLEKLILENDIDMSVEPDAKTPPYARKLWEYLNSNSADIYYGNRAINRDGSEWVQYLEHEGKPIRAGKPNLPKGADPVQRIRYATGMGGVFNFPLWHSGIWVSLRTPTQVRYFNLIREVFNQKVDLGRASNGMIFSNTNAYTINELMEFVMDHVVTSTFESSDPESLMSVIDIRDIPTLMMGMAYTMFNRGYDYQQQCIVDNDCNHVEQGEINLGRTFYVDRKSFTTEQKSFMASPVKRTRSELEQYQSMFKYDFDRTFSLDGDIMVRVGPCSLAKFRDVGYYWVQSITNAAQETFSANMTLEKRREHIFNTAIAAGICQYAHFFESVVTTDGETETEIDIEDPSNLVGVLSALQDDPTNATKMYEAVANFWKYGIHSFVGIPRYECPACKQTPTIVEDEGNNPQLIPIETVSVFFTLLVLQQQRIILREMQRRI